MSERYILVDRRSVPCPWLLSWATWMETEDRHVKETIQDDVRVSTVFLGLDHSFGQSGPPILFESMCFVAGEGVDQRRYATWEEAERGHDDMVREIFKARAILRLPG